MKIGIDIDDTITQTKELIDVYLSKYNYRYDLDGRTDFENKKIFDFFVNHIEEIQLKVKLKPGVKEAFDELKKMSYEIIIITARGGGLDYDYEKITKEYFDKHYLPYDKMYFENYPKGDVAKKEGLDYFIDDRLYNLDDVSIHGIECLHFTDNSDEKSPYKKFNNWNDIIKYLKSKEEL